MTKEKDPQTPSQSATRHGPQQNGVYGPKPVPTAGEIGVGPGKTPNAKDAKPASSSTSGRAHGTDESGQTGENGFATPTLDDAGPRDAILGDVRPKP